MQSHTPFPFTAKAPLPQANTELSASCSSPCGDVSKIASRLHSTTKNSWQVSSFLKGNCDMGALLPSVQVELVNKEKSCSHRPQALQSVVCASLAAERSLSQVWQSLICNATGIKCRLGEVCLACSRLCCRGSCAAAGGAAKDFLCAAAFMSSDFMGLKGREEVTKW